MKQQKLKYDIEEVQEAIKQVQKHLKLHKNMPQFTYPSSGLLSVGDSYICAIEAIKCLGQSKPHKWKNEDIRIIKAAYQAIKDLRKREQELAQGVYLC